MQQYQIIEFLKSYFNAFAKFERFVGYEGIDLKKEGKAAMIAWRDNFNATVFNIFCGEGISKRDGFWGVSDSHGMTSRYDWDNYDITDIKKIGDTWTITTTNTRDEKSDTDYFGHLDLVWQHKIKELPDGRLRLIYERTKFKNEDENGWIELDL